MKLKTIMIALSSAPVLLFANIEGQPQNTHNVPSGFFMSAAGGAAQTQSYYEDSWMTIWGNTSESITFPTQNKGAASVSVGYQWGFGQSNTWKNIYTGVSLNYYYFGKAIDPNASNYSNGQVVKTEYTQLNGGTVEGFVGMYLSSPLSAEFGLGGGAAADGQGALGIFKFKLAYDITPGFSVFAQYISAGFTTFGFVPFGFANAVVNSGISVDSEQVGIRYVF